MRAGSRLSCRQAASVPATLSRRSIAQQRPAAVTRQRTAIERGVDIQTIHRWRPGRKRLSSDMAGGNFRFWRMIWLFQTKSYAISTACSMTTSHFKQTGE